jgi:hypothetical protein
MFSLYSTYQRHTNISVIGFELQLSELASILLPNSNSTSFNYCLKLVWLWYSIEISCQCFPLFELNEEGVVELSSECITVCLFIHPSICLFVGLSVSVCVLLCELLCVCLSVHLVEVAAVVLLLLLNLYRSYICDEHHHYQHHYHRIMITTATVVIIISAITHHK